MDMSTILMRVWALLEESSQSALAVVSGFSPRDPAVQRVALIAAALAVGAIAILFVAKLARAKRKPGPNFSPATALADVVRGSRNLGWATILCVFVIGGVLGSLIPLSGAAVAPGFVSPDGSRKTVQHLEGGIVHRIHVREGDHVSPGQQLVSLEDTLAKANLGELRDRLVHFIALEARLTAEQAGSPMMAIPRSIDRVDPASLLDALKGQDDLFLNRRETRIGRERILRQRILQLEEESGGLSGVIVAQNEQARLITLEIASVQTLYDKGLERLPRLLSLQRAQAEVAGARASNVARIAKNKQAMGETEIELLTMRQQEREKVNEELNGVRAELASLQSKLPARSDVLARTVVAAPIAGTVMNVRVTTEAGVVRPGETLLEIVPQDAPMIVDARVRPLDVDVVRRGMTAKIVLSAFTQRNLPEFRGKLRSISADRLTDERTGESYFMAKIEVDPNQLKGLGEGFELSAGMPAEVYILTGERTALDYLIRPFIESITKSFRES
ncbi:HlyD family type I secretion periplasmic adaptor subunit [Bosea sp. PAMC 26642]|uniref:HlyD family type I secretion periplasmic adaptor subunit n=1 Tax=Bosea sp. (strain PAMC 26642) TaxID=1792307 RepID=UPI00077046BA|nr:HlyD family type I secretion periplasmic adaptor subunit [Bosea sp. PAMC 26642]AMJ62923.1 hypothetical protein AXW83_23810 [Bosea sp. PAMC 26642]